MYQKQYVDCYELLSVTKGQGREDENVLYDGKIKIRRIEVTL